MSPCEDFAHHAVGAFYVRFAGVVCVACQGHQVLVLVLQLLALALPFYELDMFCRVTGTVMSELI